MMHETIKCTLPWDVQKTESANWNKACGLLFQPTHKSKDKCPFDCSLIPHLVRSLQSDSMEENFKKSQKSIKWLKKFVSQLSDLSINSMGSLSFSLVFFSTYFAVNGSFAPFLIAFACAGHGPCVLSPSQCLVIIALYRLAVASSVILSRLAL